MKSPRILETEPAFSQGALQAFRERLIATDTDRRLLERTIELARATSESTGEGAAAAEPALHLQ